MNLLHLLATRPLPVDPPIQFICPQPHCLTVSMSPDDRRDGYCGRCRAQTGVPDPQAGAGRPGHRSRRHGLLPQTVAELAMVDQRQAAVSESVDRLLDEVLAQPTPPGTTVPDAWLRHYEQVADLAAQFAAKNPKIAMAVTIAVAAELVRRIKAHQDTR
nr:hypothetical protein [Micromonospora sp. DSM 115978]